MMAHFYGKQWTNVPHDVRRKVAPLIRDLRGFSPAGYAQAAANRLCREMQIVCVNQQDVPEFIMKAAMESPWSNLVIDQLSG